LAISALYRGVKRRLELQDTKNENPLQRSHGTHFWWRKRLFRPRWVLRGAPGCTGSITRTSNGSYVWEVSARGLSNEESISQGVEAAFSPARWHASQAVIACLRQLAQ
jgi:hypothetical protein